jgi:tripartite-type tricarboxylate transporter receptor subunit TctC
MKIRRRNLLHLAAGAAALSAVSRMARAQTYPTRPITIIVPYAPGGATDLAARALSGPLAATLGQAVIVENVSGGNALIGTGRVARASPDGYTLLVHNMAIAANVSLFPKSSFNVEKDLTAVGLVNYGVPILVGRTSLAANSLAELVAWMKQLAGVDPPLGHEGQRNCAGSVALAGSENRQSRRAGTRRLRIEARRQSCAVLASVVRRRSMPR